MEMMEWMMTLLRQDWKDSLPNFQRVDSGMDRCIYCKARHHGCQGRETCGRGKVC